MHRRGGLRCPVPNKSKSLNSGGLFCKHGTSLVFAHKDIDMWKISVRWERTKQVKYLGKVGKLGKLGRYRNIGAEVCSYCMAQRGTDVSLYTILVYSERRNTILYPILL